MPPLLLRCRLRPGRYCGSIARGFAGHPFAVGEVALADETNAPVPFVSFLGRTGAGTRPAVVYVSPLARARQTAAAVFPQVEQRIVPGFAEMDFGAFEGRGVAETPIPVDAIRGRVER